jgi:hypothetical protein
MIHAIWDARGINKNGRIEVVAMEERQLSWSQQHE